MTSATPNEPKAQLTAQGVSTGATLSSSISSSNSSSTSNGKKRGRPRTRNSNPFLKKDGTLTHKAKKFAEFAAQEEAKRQAEQSKRIYEAFEKNPLAFAMFYLPNHFRLGSPSFHYEIIQKAADNRFLAIAAPRGSSKTTILGLVHPLHKIVFKKRRFIVYLSNTFKQATMMLGTIKNELKENARLKKDYRIEITKDAEDVTVFRHPDGFETMVICLGADQMGNIRGRKFGAYRPDLIIGDDIENDEMVRSADRRLKLVEDFDNAVIPAGDIDTQYIIIGTILHDDSLLAKLMSKDQYREYHKVFFKGLYKKKTGEYFSLWPEKMSVEWLLAYKKDKPHTFAREIQNDPSSSGTEEFNKADFRYWRIENMQYLLFDEDGNIKSRGDLRDCKAAIACDLAWEDKQESDFSAIVPGFITPQSDILIEDYICRKGMRPNEFEEALFSMEQRLSAITGNVVPIGFEKAKLEKVVKWFLQQAMRSRNRYLILKDLLWGKEKVERIVTRLQPRYTQHSIYHKRGMGDLELQLLRIRSTSHDDLADAVQGLVQLLQYPKGIKQKAVADPDQSFMRLRQWHIDKHKPKKHQLGRFVMGTRQSPLAAAVCPI